MLIFVSPSEIYYITHSFIFIHNYGNIICALHSLSGVSSMSAMYAGTLTAVLAVPAFESSINSLWDLVEAANNKDYKVVIVYETSTESIFKVSLFILALKFAMTVLLCANIKQTVTAMKCRTCFIVEDYIILY